MNVVGIPCFLRRQAVFCRAFVRLFLLMLVGQCALAQMDLFNRANANFTSVPAAVRQKSGKYPARLPILLWMNSCKEPGTGVFDADATYTVFPAAAGVAVDGAVTPLGCKLTVTLTIDDSATDGFVILSIQKQKGQGKPELVGYAALQFVDAAAGPTPGDPAVDVQWVPLSKKMCQDSFGRAVGDKVLCIEVKLGNNSGHSLQLAGLGFKPTQSALLCKRTADAGAGQSAAVPGSGKGRSFGPKPVSLQESCEPETYEVPSVITPNVSYQSVRASMQVGDHVSARNIFVGGTQALGILMSSFTPYFRDTFNKARWTSGVAVIGTALPGALGQVLPDQLLFHLNNLDDQSLRDGKIIANNSQIRTMVFVERALFKGFGGMQYEETCRKLYGSMAKELQTCIKKMDDPYAERLALGKIVLVGDYVDYIQRVVVASGVESGEVTPPPTIQQAVANGTTLTADIKSQGQTVTSAVLIDSKGVITHLDIPPDSNPNKIQFSIPAIEDKENARQLRLEFKDGKVDQKSVTIK